MNQSYIWAVVIVVLVLATAFYFWQTYQPQLPLQDTVQDTGGPKVDVVINPTENFPEINPLEKANPFTKTYQNPF